MEFTVTFDNWHELRNKLLNAANGLPMIATPDQPAAVTPATTQAPPAAYSAPVAPAAQIAPAAAPTAAPKIYTFAEVRAATQPLIDAGKKDDCLRIRRERCNDTPLSEMTPEQLALYAAGIRELGAAI